MSTSPFLLTIFLALLGYILPTFAQEAVEGVAQQAAEAAMPELTPEQIQQYQEYLAQQQAMNPSFGVAIPQPLLFIGFVVAISYAGYYVYNFLNHEDVLTKAQEEKRQKKLERKLSKNAKKAH